VQTGPGAAKTKPVRKAVIAAAGFGTRFLPQTKAMPKEMLPVVDKPIIQYVVEELVDAGIEDIVIVTGYHKRSIEDHFDYISGDLRANLKKAGKNDLLEETKKISDLANFAYVRQKGPYGNATPLISAAHLIGDEPFIYTWGDDFVLASPSRFRQITDAHEKHGGSILTCVRAQSDDDYKKYGFIGGQSAGDSIIKVEKIVEKPGSGPAAPSDLASVSGYIFEPVIFDYLADAMSGLDEGQEFIFQPSLQKMIEEDHKVYGCEIQNGQFYDTGDKLEYLKTVVDFALMHDELKENFRAYLEELL
jgi:UTP--glucose-1-phosphate uridylyltransferase